LIHFAKRKEEDMRNKRTKLLTALVVSAVVGLQPAALNLRADDTNTVEQIKRQSA
jgi:hypothetical protein